MSSRSLKEPEADEMLPWLSDEIMYLIIGKLMLFPSSLARFSAVCKRWHRLVFNAWPKLLKEHQITPFVLAPAVEDRKEAEGIQNVVSYRIHNLMGECVQVNSLPYGSSRIIGSSFGWLIVTDRDETSVWLFNPFSRSLILLPPLLLLPLNGTVNRKRLLKGVLSNQPDGHFDIAITMTPGPESPRSNRNAIAFAYLHVEKEKMGDLHWVMCSGYHVIDVNGIGGRIFVLEDSGTIRCCKWNSSLGCMYCKYVVSESWLPLRDDIYGSVTSAYLLESSSSETLVALRYKKRHSSSGRWSTVGFKIFSNDETWNWNDDNNKAVKMMEIKTLGNDVLFLGDNGSVCIQAAAGSKLQPSSIYFTDEYGPPQGATHDFGVFNFDQNCFTHGSDGDGILATKALPSTWLLPSYDEILKFSG